MSHPHDYRLLGEPDPYEPSYKCTRCGKRVKHSLDTPQDPREIEDCPVECLNAISNYETAAKYLDPLVWKCLDYYLEVYQVYFSDPEQWCIDEGEVRIFGENGACGHYESEEVIFSVEALYDPEGFFNNLKNGLEKTRLEKERKRKEADRLKDEAEYNRLKKKLGK